MEGKKTFPQGVEIGSKWRKVHLTYKIIDKVRVGICRNTPKQGKDHPRPR